MTHCNEILDFMRTHHGITNADASQFGCYRLSGRILELRRRGYDIETQWEETEKEGRSIRYGRYILHEEETD